MPERHLFSRAGFTRMLAGFFVIWMVQIVLGWSIGPHRLLATTVSPRTETVASRNGAYVAIATPRSQGPIDIAVVRVADAQTATFTTEPLILRGGMSISDDGRWFVSTPPGRYAVVLFDTHTGRTPYEWPYTYGRSVTPDIFLFITPDNTQVVLVQGFQIYVWRIADGALVWHREGESPIGDNTCDLSSDGTLLVCVSSAGVTLEVWRVADGTHLASLPLADQAATVSFASAAPTLAVGFQTNAGGRIEIWRQDGETLTRQSATDVAGWVTTSALSPDGTRLVTGSSTGGGGGLFSFDVPLLRQPDRRTVWSVTSQGVAMQHTLTLHAGEQRLFFTPTGALMTTRDLAQFTLPPFPTELPWFWLSVLSAIIVPLIWLRWKR